MQGKQNDVQVQEFRLRQFLQCDAMWAVEWMAKTQNIFIIKLEKLINLFD